MGKDVVTWEASLTRIALICCLLFPPFFLPQSLLKDPGCCVPGQSARQFLDTPCTRVTAGRAGGGSATSLPRPSGAEHRLLLGLNTVGLLPPDLSCSRNSLSH